MSETCLPCHRYTMSSYTHCRKLKYQEGRVVGDIASGMMEESLIEIGNSTIDAECLVK